ncbi:hypothetical protein EON65_51790 [archaeon]|nr:MAG: hypothetical protein EON65_51790 [archaeon]
MFKINRHSSSNSLSSSSSLESGDDWDASLFNSLLEEDVITRTSSSGSNSSLINTSIRIIGSSNKRPRPSIDEKEVKKTIRKRRAVLSIEERKREDKDAEKRYQFAFTRMVSYDVRRYIPQMHINTVNSPDSLESIRQFFNDFALPNVQCTNKLAPSIYALPVAFFMKREDVINLWASYVACHPDGACKLLGTQIIRKYNSKTSEVRMTVHFKGTYEKVIDPTSPPPNTTASSSTSSNRLESDPLLSNPAHSDSVFDVSYLTHSTSQVSPQPPFSTYPSVQVVELTPVNVVMYIGFHMNADNFITNIDIDGRFVPDPVLSQYYVKYKAENLAEEVVVRDNGVVVGLKGAMSDRIEEVFE